MKTRMLFVSLTLGLSCAIATAGESMFNEKTYHSLVADQKAFKVGDAVTVLIQESAVASTSVDAKANRTTDVGVSGQVTGHSAKGLTASVNSGGDGGGQTNRSGRVTAQITVSVVGVSENGELMISGQQSVDLNGEAQVISVVGRVRPRDISDGNAVLSSRIADARITYTGQGYLSEKSKPSVLSRLFNFLGL